MSDSKALRDAAAILLDQANKLEGKPSTYFGQDLAPILEMWNSMLAQFAAEDAKRVDEAKCYETHKNLWKAAEREGWPSNLGGRFWSGNYKNAHDFTVAIKALLQTDKAKEWLAHPANANYLPKGEPLE